jgi:hypothetical protein
LTLWVKWGWGVLISPIIITCWCINKSNHYSNNNTNN